MPATRHQYQVVVRAGSETRCVWRLLPQVYTDAIEAARYARSIQESGFHAVVKTVRELQTVGMPIGWEPGRINWEYDHILYTPHETTWVSHHEGADRHG